jgi:type I restriction enzyme S subunit
MRILDEICEVITCGVAKRPEYVSSGVPFLSSKNVKKDRFILNHYNFISEEDYQQLTKYNRPEKGDVLYTRVGSFGEAAVVDFDFKFAVFVSLTLIKPKHDIVNARYLMHYLNSPKIVSLANSSTSGIGVQNLNVNVVRKFPVDLPPLPQQQKIANILDAADALRQNDKALIAKYDELTQALFLDMFGDPVSNPKGWEKKEILDLINPSRPITYGILMPKEDVKPMGIPYIKVVDVKNGLILHDRVCHTTEIIESKYKRSRLKENDLLISIRGHVGRICLVPQIYINANITQDTARLDFNKEIEPLFAEYCLGSTEFQRYMSKYVKGAGVKGINLGDLKKLLMIVPDINIQKKFASAVLSLKLQKAIAQKSLEKSEELFNSLLQKAFKGELV